MIKGKQRLAAILTFVVAALASTLTFSQEHFSAKKNWQTLESKHFRLTYSEDNPLLAKKTLIIAEKLFPTLSVWFDWTPSEPIELLISDVSDQPNGYASPFPYNRVVLLSAQPTRYGELSDHGDWLETLILHELTHVFHLDKARALPESLRYLLGRNIFLFPNIFQPDFLKEGLATYLETSWTNRNGRGQSALYEMVLRTEVDNGLLPLAKLQQRNRDWPFNQAYSYGVAFYQFLDEQFGPDAAWNMIRQLSGQIIPFRLNPAIQLASGTDSIESLWPLFEQWLSQRYLPQIAGIRGAGLPESTQLTHSGYSTGGPVTDNEGNIFYTSFDAYQPAYLTKMDAQGHIEHLIRAYGDVEIIARHGSSLWYLQDALCKHNQVSKELYQLDLDTLESKKRSDCMHFIQADVRQVTDQTVEVYALKEINGRQAIVRYDPQTKTETRLLEGHLNEIFASVHVVNDGQHLVYAHKLRNQPWRIEGLDLTSKQQSVLLEDTETDFYSVMPGPDNHFLFIESDQDNLVEIWRSDMEGRNLTQMTRSIGGATRPAIDSKNQRLIYRGYSHEGWNIYAKALEPVAAGTVARLPRPGTGLELGIDPESRPLSHTTSKNPEVEQHEYQASQSVLPTTWFLNIASDAAQTTATLLLSGRDVLNFHNWSLNIGRDFKNDLPVGQLSYTLFNHFNFSYEKYYEYQVGSASAPTEFIDEAVTEEAHSNYSLSAFFNHPLTGPRTQFFAGSNVNDQEFTNLIQQRPYFDRRVTTLGAGVMLDSSIRPLKSLGPVFGRSLKLTLEHDTVEAKSFSATQNTSIKTTGRIWSADWREYIHLYQAHRLELRMFAAYGERGSDLFDLGGSSLRSSFTDNLLHLREFSLRGYPDQSRELFGRKPRIFSGDYQFPIMDVDRGITGWPLGMYELSGTLFYESGEADKEFERYDAAGVELALGLDLGYGLLPVSISAGLAQPLQDTQANRTKDANLYFKLGLSL